MNCDACGHQDAVPQHQQEMRGDTLQAGSTLPANHSIRVASLSCSNQGPFGAATAEQEIDRADPSLFSRDSPPCPFFEHTKSQFSLAKATVATFSGRLRRMSTTQILWISLLVCLVMVGNFLQIIMLNFWLVSFPSDRTAGNYTAFAVPGILFSVFFVLLLFVYMIVKRPSIRFAKHAYGWYILVGVGFCDTFNSWLATYAASYTSEVLQALFSNLCPLYAVFMAKWVLHDPRTYFNGCIISVFALTIAGILAACLYGMIQDRHLEDGRAWISIFFLSIPFRVLMNIWQSLYMIVYTKDSAFAEWLRHRLHRGTFGDHAASERGTCAHRLSVTSQPPSAATTLVEQSFADSDVESNAGRLLIAPPSSASVSKPLELPGGSGGEQASSRPEKEASSVSREPEQDRVRTSPSHATAQGSKPYLAADDVMQEIVTIRYHQGEDMIVKLMMLAGETFFQMCFTLALLPADAIPWWGNSNSVSETWTNFEDGIVCVFTIRKNFIYGFLYTLGFVLTYFGCAYLNHYSVGLCSIVGQLSSPITALVLVLVPSWNVMEGGDSPWYCSVVAIFLLSVAALVYVLWEEITDDEKMEGERVLKMNKLRVRPLNPATIVMVAEPV